MLYGRVSRHVKEARRCVYYRRLRYTCAHGEAESGEGTTGGREERREEEVPPLAGDRHACVDQRRYVDTVNARCRRDEDRQINEEIDKERSRDNVRN